MCREEICSRFPIPKWFSFIQQTHTRRAVEKLKVIERQTTKTRTFQGGQSCKLFNTFSVWLSILAFWTLARQNTWLCNGCRAMLQETAKWHSIDNKHQHTDNISFFLFSVCWFVFGSVLQWDHVDLRLSTLVDDSRLHCWLLRAMLN